MKVHIPAAVLALALSMLTASVGAEECVPTTSDPEFDSANSAGTGVGSPTARYYIDNDPCQPDCLYSVWFYPESNDIDGLQRGDEMKDDTCGGMILADGWYI